METCSLYARRVGKCRDHLLRHAVQERLRVDRLSVVHQLIVQVRSGRRAARTAQRDELTLRHALAGAHARRATGARTTCGSRCRGRCPP